MSLPLEKLRSLELDIASERGEFELFALLLREGSPDRWDLVVSAPWTDPKTRDPLDYLVRKLREILKPFEFMMISRIVLLEKGDAILEAILDIVRTEHGLVEFADIALNGLEIRQAFFITAQGRPVQKRRHRKTRGTAPPGG